MWKNIIIGIVVLAGIVIGGAYVLPQNAHVERVEIIKAAPDEIFTIVNDWTRFNEWSPWAQLDPNAKYTIDPLRPPSGKGARFSWTSEDPNVGNGSQEIVESEPFKLIKTKLDFGSEGSGYSTFTFEPVDGGTRVVWAFDTDLGMNPVSRYVGLMFDSWIGKDYEAGLARLKALVEAQSNAATQAALAAPGGAAPPDIELSATADPAKGPEIVRVEAKVVVLTRASAKSNDEAALSAALGGAYQKLLTYAEANGLEVGGPPLAVTISHSADGDWVFDAAMPLNSIPALTPVPADGVKVGETYAGRVLKVTHKGPYLTLTNTYDRLHTYAAEHKLKEKAISWEEYVSDPGETQDADLLTNVYLAVE